jgi:hypothetical protein
MPVLATQKHTHITRGDASVKQQPDATYKIGNSTVNIFAPPPMTEEEIDKVLDDFHLAGWAIIEELLEKGEEV